MSRCTPSGCRPWSAATSAVAALVSSDDVTGVTPEQRASVRELTASRAEDSGRTDVSVLLPGAVVTSTAPEAGLPEYRLVPQAGVMVTGQNLDPGTAQGQMSLAGFECLRLGNFLPFRPFTSFHR